MDKEINIQSFLSFKVGNQNFAIHVAKVNKIIEPGEITKIPHAPKFIKGIINLRGNVVPVLDGRSKLGFEETAFTKNTCIIILEFLHNSKQELIGMIVDQVDEVMEFSADQIQPSPYIQQSDQNDFLKGVYHKEEEHWLILNIDQILASIDVVALDQNS